MKLNDFNREIKIKKDIIMLIKLYKQLLNTKDDEHIDTYDTIDVRIETFIIDSIYYILLRSHELYKTKS